MKQIRFEQQSHSLVKPRLKPKAAVINLVHPIQLPNPNIQPLRNQNIILNEPKLPGIILQTLRICLCCMQNQHHILGHTSTPEFDLVVEWSTELSTARQALMQRAHRAPWLPAPELDNSETYWDTPALFFPPVGYIKSNYAQILIISVLQKQI